MKHSLSLIVLFLVLSIQAGNISGLSIPSPGVPGGYHADGLDSATVSMHLLQGDSITHTINVSTSSAIDIIIELNEQPFMRAAVKAQKKFGSRKHAKSIAAIQQSIDIINNAHETLKSNLQRIDSEDASKRKSTIRHEYRGVFNGIALRTYSFQLERLRKLPSIKRIHPDYQVKAVLAESIPKIHADDLWALGYTGQGTIIGIIDAGIDYNHPALGGGFGPEYKVIGGYDFVNNDNDPMDDNSHGTHVAGIAAGNGDIRGVAPDAKLVAYKVLNSAGTGLLSNVIAAMEKSCDPDGDPLTDDALDVVNMSLTGQGNGNDPLSQVIDNASAAGVVCVAAAGNSGTYLNLGSPASAAAAITVGASDDIDKIAVFSSRGPTTGLFTIKPDVVAPGVAIRSTLPGNKYGENAGTSMAAPHVAGLAALLLQIHPGWPAEKIKQCIMLSADDCGANVFTQGSGRVNALKAMDLKTIISPASISFGIDTANSGLFVKSFVLKITNIGTEQVAYTLTASLKSQQSGITLDLSPTTLLLQSGDSASVTLTITVDNAVVPDISVAPYAYIGNVAISGDGESVNVPFAILKADVIGMHLREFPSFIMVHNRAGKSQTISSFDSITNAVVPPGIYDIIVHYGEEESRDIVKENIPSGSTVEIGKSDAVFSATVTTVDNQGNNLSIKIGTTKFVHRTTNTGYITGGGFYPSRTFSNMSSEYKWEWELVDYANAIVHQFRGGSNGFSHDTLFTNTPSDLREYTYRYHVPPSMNGLRTPLTTTTSPYGGSYAFSTYDPVDPPVVYPFTNKAYYMPFPSDEFSLGFTFRKVFEYGASPENLLFQSPFVKINSNGSYEAHFYSWQGIPFYSSTSDTIDIGIGPLFWMGRFNNSSNTMRLIPLQGYNQMAFCNQTGDLIPHKGTPYTLYQNGSPVWDATLNNYGNDLCTPVSITPGTYTFKTQCDAYFIRDVQGSVKVSATFNTLMNDRCPPTIKDFHIESQGKRTAIVNQDRPSIISIELWENFLAALAVTAYYRIGPDTTWVPLALTSQGLLNTAEPPPLMENAYVSLKIIAHDTSGNEMICEMSPAYFVQAHNNPPVLAAIGDKTVAESQLLQFSLLATDDDNDTLAFSAAGLPPGASFDPMTATLTWQPDFNQAGTYPNITFTVSDGESTDEETITITVANTNRSPVAVHDTLSTNEDLQIIINVLNNDSDPDNDPLQVLSVQQPNNGTAAINADNTITYVPYLNYSGPDQFSYSITDGFGGAASANVVCAVAAVNDTPTVTITSPVNGAVFNRYGTIAIKATASDIDGTVAKVAFTVDGVLRGQDTSSPYEYTWRWATSGTHNLVCKAYDNGGATGASMPVTIRVK